MFDVMQHNVYIAQILQYRGNKRKKAKPVRSNDTTIEEAIAPIKVKLCPKTRESVYKKI